jgi:chemotaxis signal transduction protein
MLNGSLGKAISSVQYHNLIAVMHNSYSGLGKLRLTGRLVDDAWDMMTFSSDQIKLVPDLGILFFSNYTRSVTADDERVVILRSIDLSSMSSKSHCWEKSQPSNPVLLLETSIS